MSLLKVVIHGLNVDITKPLLRGFFRSKLTIERDQCLFFIKMENLQNAINETCQKWSKSYNYH